MSARDRAAREELLALRLSALKLDADLAKWELEPLPRVVLERVRALRASLTADCALLLDAVTLLGGPL